MPQYQPAKTVFAQAIRKAHDAITKRGDTQESGSQTSFAVKLLPGEAVALPHGTEAVTREFEIQILPGEDGVTFELREDGRLVSHKPDDSLVPEVHPAPDPPDLEAQFREWWEAWLHTLNQGREAASGVGFDALQKEAEAMRERIAELAESGMSDDRDARRQILRTVYQRAFGPLGERLYREWVESAQELDVLTAREGLLSTFLALYLEHGVTGSWSDMLTLMSEKTTDAEGVETETPASLRPQIGGYVAPEYAGALRDAFKRNSVRCRRSFRSFREAAKLSDSQLRTVKRQLGYEGRSDKGLDVFARLLFGAVGEAVPGDLTPE